MTQDYENKSVRNDPSDSDDVAGYDDSDIGAPEREWRELTAQGAPQRAEALKRILEKLDSAGWLGVRPTSCDQFEGVIPFQGCGEVGDEYWYFRFRSDHATLSVGTRDEKHDFVSSEDARLFAELRVESEEPYGATFANDDEAIEMVAHLWLELQPRIGGAS